MAEIENSKDIAMEPELPKLPQLPTAEQWNRETRFPFFKPLNDSLTALDAALKLYDVSRGEYEASRKAYREQSPAAALREIKTKYDRAADDFERAESSFSKVEAAEQRWRQLTEPQRGGGPVRELHDKIAGAREAIENGKSHLGMKIIAREVGPDGRLEAEIRSVEAIAFWRKLSKPGTTATVDGERFAAKGTLAKELKDRAGQRKTEGARSIAIEYERRKITRQLDWNEFSDPEAGSVAVYIPKERKEKVAEILDDVSDKIKTAAEKGVNCFVAPEYLFTKRGPDGQTPLSKMEHEDLRGKLEELSRRYPETVIVAGTSLWVNDEQKLQNTALVLMRGQLDEYNKATIPHGDGLLKAALAHHVNSRPAGGQGRVAAESITDNSSLGNQPYFDILSDSKFKYRVAICSDISAGTEARKHVDIELVPAHALGLIEASTHHVHQGGHVFIADGVDGAWRFGGGEQGQVRLEGGENGLYFHNFEVRKQLQSLEQGVTEGPAPAGQPTSPQPQQRPDHMPTRSGSASMPTRRLNSPARPAISRKASPSEMEQTQSRRR